MTSTSQRVRVSTTQYEFSHGRKPRGEGGWAFVIGGSIFWAAPATYAVARAEAIAHARSLSIEDIEVAP